MSWPRADVFEASGRLNGTQQANLTADLGLGEVVTPGQALVVWVVDLLALSNLADSDRIRLLLGFLAGRIAGHGDAVHAAMESDDEKLPVAHLGFGDRDLVSVTGSAEVMDLKNGRRFSVLPTQLLETVNYNLTTLYVRQSARILRNREAKDGSRNVKATEPGAG